ncbi:carbohydrate ABC transporter permease [Ammoniphilus sp. YIM 78166]|uniref:carbohydrate ABC transporter permease n=1 Tax=Ammoniphilus sp. YIM 78166 TaxID=1644106 RepID=UPI00106FC904|nr:sugar ABC transporter permease [Ammoniphilus sp. YIM 78166]
MKNTVVESNAGALPLPKTKSKISPQTKRKWLWCYLFLLPQTVLYLSFTLYPIVMSYVYAFYDWSGIGPMNDFVGFENFTETFFDPLFWNAFKNSFIFMGALVLVQVPLALLMAILFSASWLKGSAFYRTLYFLPVVTTTAIVGLVMRFIFGAYKGLFNEVLLRLGLISQPIDWLGSVDTALLIVCIVGIWKTFGIKVIYWLAGLQSVPKELYEAAKVDGASPFQVFRFITIPLLIPVGSVIVLLSAVNALHVFDLVQAMTGGGPSFSTDMVDVYIYRYAFGGGGESRVGFASAAGVVYGFAILIVSLALGALARKTGGKKGRAH